MGIGKHGAVRRQLRTLFNVGAVRELTDGQLLERFATERGEAAELAFAVLVERHGPMVMRVCRGVLADHHDIQDAFQATFLVLVKRARGLWVRRFARPLAAPGRLPDRDVCPGHRGPPSPPRTTGGDERGRPGPSRTSSSSGSCTRRSTGFPSVIARPSSSATSRAAPTSRPRDTWAGRSARSRAGSPAPTDASATACSAAAWLLAARALAVRRGIKAPPCPSPLPCWMRRRPPRCDSPGSVRP